MIKVIQIIRARLSLKTRTSDITRSCCPLPSKTPQASYYFPKRRKREREDKRKEKRKRERKKGTEVKEISKKIHIIS